MMSVKKNRFDFNVPLTREEIEAAQVKREKNHRYDLGGIIAANKGQVSRGLLNETQETPMINGYKMLKETP